MTSAPWNPDWLLPQWPAAPHVRALCTTRVGGVSQPPYDSLNLGTPAWSHDGVICTGESYKTAVKLTFLKGASLADPDGLFNASLDGNARRAIDIHEGETLDAKKFKALIRAAIALNAPKPKAPSARKPARHK